MSIAQGSKIVAADFNSYYWERTKVTPYYFLYSGVNSYSDTTFWTKVNKIIYTPKSSTTRSCSTEGYTINSSTGEISLISTDDTPGYDGCFIIDPSSDNYDKDGTIVHEFYVNNSESTSNYYIANSYYIPTSAARSYYEYIYETTDYVFSTNRNAYPDESVQNGYYYKYQGKFNEWKPTTVIKSYVGTGENGGGNASDDRTLQHSLTFDQRPKAIIFPYGHGNRIIFDKEEKQVFYIDGSYSTVNYQWEGNTLYWYADILGQQSVISRYEMNSKDVIYNYLCIY